MEVNDYLIKFLGCHEVHWSIVENSNLDVCAGIMVGLVLKKYVLSTDFLHSLLTYKFKALVCHVVVRVRLFNCEFSGEHRSVDLKIGVNAVENHFCAFFNKLVVVLQVKKEEHSLVVVSVRGHPVSELLTCVIGSNLVKSSVCHHSNASAYSSIF